MKAMPVALALFLPLGCGSGNSEQSPSDEMGLLSPPSIRYELRATRNAARVRINGEVELIVCETFSEGCHLHDLPSPLPRIRHHEETVDLTPYLHPGPNTIEVSHHPDGEEEPLQFTIRRSESGKHIVLADREIAPSAEPSLVSVETAAGCTPPPLPSADWMVTFLDPYPEAFRTWSDSHYTKMLVPPVAAHQGENRKKQLQTLRDHSIAGAPLPKSAVRQTHRSGPLSINYSCEAGRLFAYPSDGAYLVAIVDILDHAGGRESRAAHAAAVEFVHTNGRWYLGRF